MAETPQHRFDRLDELAKLEPGWHDGEGKAINPASVEQARIYLSVVGGEPGIFPNPDGYIQFEWLTDDSHVVIEFNTEAEDGGVFCFTLPADERA